MKTKQEQDGMTLGEANELNRIFYQEILEEIRKEIERGVTYPKAKDVVFDRRGYFAGRRDDMSKEIDKLYNSD